MVPVGDDYVVAVGRGVVATAAELLPQAAAQVLIVHTRTVAAAADAVAEGVASSGRVPLLHEVPDAEAGKTASVASAGWEALGRADFTRSDAVMGVGGGAVTDLAGFLAATWLRGVVVVQVPTSLAGMVDAAVGGKTGINTPQGKNLVGSFHPPVGVVCDVDLLRTLPAQELLPGMAEVVKHGFIADPRTLELIEADPVAALDPAGDVLLELVTRSVQVKAGVVAADLKESFLREILNYGHTFGHAVEQVHDYTWRHGNAVSVGLVFAAALGRLAGRTDAALAARHSAVLSSLGLPTTYADRTGGRWPDLLAAMRRDKKSRGALLRFVVLDGLAEPGRLEGPSEELLRAAYAEVSGG
ncbi:MAG: 3-dehydroquinate synthase [Phycicoccus sp.]|nr:3-dehydroquinate synthase [Phycicoccus sp.]